MLFVFTGKELNTSSVKFFYRKNEGYSNNLMQVRATSQSTQVTRYQRMISGTSSHCSSMPTVPIHLKGMTSSKRSIVTSDIVSSYKPSKSADHNPHEEEKQQQPQEVSTGLLSLAAMQLKQ